MMMKTFQQKGDLWQRWRGRGRWWIGGSKGPPTPARTSGTKRPHPKNWSYLKFWNIDDVGWFIPVIYSATLIRPILSVTLKPCSSTQKRPIWVKTKCPPPKTKSYYLKSELKRNIICVQQIKGWLKWGCLFLHIYGHYYKCKEKRGTNLEHAVHLMDMIRRLTSKYPFQIVVISRIGPPT